MIYFYLSTAIFIGSLWIAYWVDNQYHLDIVVTKSAAPVEAPLISVCVPARNEETNIRACVESILRQDYPGFEVIVLDDRSTDRTPTILHELEATDVRLRVIMGAEVPAGWVGKPHALFQASAAARGEWLCFVDADTFLAPYALSSCLAKARETGADLFTVMTFQIPGSFWEKVIMPLVLTALSVGFSPRRVNDPHRKDAIANGQFIMIQRAVYDAIGGHEGVKDQIVEDKALAQQVKWRGYRLIVADGSAVARTRMYTSLSEMWEGWTKNIYLGLRDQPSLTLLGVFGAFLLLVAALILPLWPVLATLWYQQGGGWLALAALAESLIVWAVVISTRARVARGLNISPWYALTLPLGAAVFAAMMFVSAWKVISGQGVVWRGRTYATKQGG